MGFTSRALKTRQRVIDDYLLQTGRTIFVPEEFLVWLSDQPDHECYDLFFGMEDQDAAMEYRKDLVRKWCSGLRLRVDVEQIPEVKGRKVRVQEYEIPAMVSPRNLRLGSGGYYFVSPDNPEHMDELAAQAAESLDTWLRRYGGVAEMRGVKLTPITKIADQLRVCVEAPA